MAGNFMIFFFSLTVLCRTVVLDHVITTYRIKSNQENSVHDIQSVSRTRSLIECVTASKQCASLSYHSKMCKCHNVSADALRTHAQNNSFILEYIDQLSSAYLNQNDYLGGYDGAPFTDESYSIYGDITALKLVCSQYFQGIAIRYGNHWAPDRGNGAQCQYNSHTLIEFATNEYIVSMTVNFGGFIDGITFTTNKRVLPKCGGDGGNNVKSVSGRKLLYLSGEAGCYMDGVQGHWMP